MPKTTTTAAGDVPSLGSTIRKWRKAKGLTLIDLSNETGLSITTISEIERNAREPKLPLLKTICEALGKPVSKVVNLPMKGHGIA